MVFARSTSVVAKLGLSSISGELGLTLRTFFVFLFVLLFAFVSVPADELPSLSKGTMWWLGLSGVTTSLSWILYYKTLKHGEVSTIALIDKGSVVVAVFLAYVIFKR